MAQNKSNLKKFSILLAIILLAVLIPQHQALAVCPVNPADCVIGALQKVNEIMLEGVGTILQWAALTLEAVVRPETQAVIINTFVVQESWKIIRDFVNMFFILFLIIMAFGTIFNIPKYRWGDLLAPLLIAALLVNFSLVIGQYVIEVGNGLAAVFLRQIAGFGQEMANGFDIEKAIPGKEFTSQGLAMIANNSARVIFTGIFSLVFLTIALFAFLAALIFTIIRIPILWFLLIISPIAWIGYVLPSLRGQTWSEWWKHFFCWCFFLPYYLFFLMFAVMFIRRKNELAALPPSQGAALFTGPGGALSDLLLYILTLLFLVGGLAIARKMACATGSGVKTVFGKIDAGVKKYMPGAAYARGAWGGLKERGEQIKEKGVLGIGGAQRMREAEARAKGLIAGIPGLGRVPGAREAASRAMATEVDNEVKKLQQLNLTLDQLNERLKSARGPEKLAAFKLKAENGWLDATDLDQINEIMSEVGGGRTAMGASIIQSLKKGHFHEMAKSTFDKERIFSSLTDLETQKAFGLDMAESREIMSADLAKKLLDLYGSDTKEVRDKVEKTVKDNIENIARDESARKDLVNGAGIYAGVDVRIRKLAAQVAVDKKEVNSWQMRRQVLELNGGIDPATGDAKTAEGRKLASDMKDSNVSFKEEADYRKARPAISHTADLDPTQCTELENQIVDNVKTGLIRNLSTEELKSPVIFNALYNGRATGSLTTDEFNKALGVAVNKKTGALEIRGTPDRKKRKAINDLLTATGPMPYP